MKMSESPTGKVTRDGNEPCYPTVTLSDIETYRMTVTGATIESEREIVTKSKNEPYSRIGNTA